VSTARVKIVFRTIATQKYDWTMTGHVTLPVYHVKFIYSFLTMIGHSQLV